MTKRKTVIQAMVAAIVAAGSAPASAAAVFNPANGHWYDYVATPVVFADALTGAAGATPIPGFQSHLATVTSAAENNFIVSSVTVQRTWIAGSDADVEGVWRWVAGPESGQIFFGPGAPDGAYSNWSVGEPNNSNNEDVLQINWPVAGGWNDSLFDRSFGYIVEYSPVNGAIPEPSTWAMMLIGFGAIGFAMRRKPKVLPKGA